jgi:hypothetical protein
MSKVFHLLDEPFFLNPYGIESGISALHNLYPGRPMTVNDSFLSEYLIPNEDPEGAKRTFETSRANTKEYAKMLNDSVMAQNGGDNNKVLIHAVEDPSAVINDPDLKNAQMMTPETLGEGQAIPEPPKVKSPIVEGFENVDGKTCNSSENFDPFLKNLIFAFVIILAIIFLMGFLAK